VGANSETLLRQAAAGDAHALEQLIQFHEPNLLAFVRSRAGEALRARESVRDLLQEVLLEVARGVPHVEYRSEAEFRGWLYALAERRVLDRARHYRREKREGAGLRSIDDPEAYDELLIEGFSSVLSPSHVLQRKEEVHQLEHAFSQLPPQDREVLSLAFFCGMTSSEIGSKLGISPDSARQRKNRAKTRLAALWDGSDGAMV